MRNPIKMTRHHKQNDTAIESEQTEKNELDGSNTEDPIFETDLLRSQIEKLEADVAEQKDNYLRTLAEFQNFRRRTDEQRGEIVQMANLDLIKGILPVLDNFERALISSEQSQSYEGLVNGLQLTLKLLNSFFEKSGVAPIETIGKEFDPAVHEAVIRDEESDLPENSIVAELQKGYTMHGRVIRPAMVKVAQKV